MDKTTIKSLIPTINDGIRLKGDFAWAWGDISGVENSFNYYVIPNEVECVSEKIPALRPHANEWGNWELKFVEQNILRFYCKHHPSDYEDKKSNWGKGTKNDPWLDAEFAYKCAVWYANRFCNYFIQLCYDPDYPIPCINYSKHGKATNLIIGYLDGKTYFSLEGNKHWDRAGFSAGIVSQVRNNSDKYLGINNGVVSDWFESFNLHFRTDLDNKGVKDSTIRYYFTTGGHVFDGTGLNHYVVRRSTGERFRIDRGASTKTKDGDWLIFANASYYTKENFEYEEKSAEVNLRCWLVIRNGIIIDYNFVNGNTTNPLYTQNLSYDFEKDEITIGWSNGDVIFKRSGNDYVCDQNVILPTGKFYSKLILKGDGETKNLYGINVYTEKIDKTISKPTNLQFHFGTLKSECLNWPSDKVWSYYNMPCLNSENALNKICKLYEKQSDGTLKDIGSFDVDFEVSIIYPEYILYKAENLFTTYETAYGGMGFDAVIDSTFEIKKSGGEYYQQTYYIEGGILYNCKINVMKTNYYPWIRIEGFAICDMDFKCDGIVSNMDEVKYLTIYDSSFVNCRTLYRETLLSDNILKTSCFVRSTFEVDVENDSILPEIVTPTRIIDSTFTIKNYAQTYSGWENDYIFSYSSKYDKNYTGTQAIIKNVTLNLNGECKWWLLTRN